MNWTTIRGAGHLLVRDDLPRFDGRTVTRELLNDLSRAFVHECTRYWKATKEPPFVWGERQLHSMLHPALHDVCEAVLAEQPVSRRVEGKEHSGRIDYWAAREDTVFIVEFKQAWVSLRTDTLSEVCSAHWSTAIKQLRGVPKAWEPFLAMGRRRLVKLALMSVAFHKAAGDKHTLTPLGVPLAEHSLDTVNDELRPAPDWSCMWLVHRRLQRPFKYVSDDEWYDLYPCVGLVAKVVGTFTR